MNGRRARAERRAKRERAVAVATGAATPTLDELLHGLRQKRALMVAQAAAARDAAIAEARERFAADKAAIEDEFQRSAEAIRHATAARDSGIVLATADVDLGKVAEELDALSGVRR